MGRMDDAHAPVGARKKNGGGMRHRDVTVVFMVGSLILTLGCGRSPDEPVPAPQASTEQGAAGMQGVPGPAGDAGGTPAGHGVDAVPSNVPPDPDPSGEDSGSHEEDFADVLARIRSLMADTDFAAADTLCRETEGMFKAPANTAELTALAEHIHNAKREASKLRYAVEQLGSPDSTVIGVATGELLGAGDTGRLFLRHALREGSSAIAGKAARALVMDNDGQAVPLMLDRVTRDTDPLLGREIGAALLRLKRHLTVAQLTHCHALLASDRTTARHGLLPVLADIFAGGGAGDANRHNAWLSATDGFDALRHYTERLLASGDAGLVAFAAPVAGLIGLTIPGLHVENQINRRFAEAIALPVTAELANLASGNESARTNAYAVLRAAGDLGRAVLYRAVRDGNPAEAKAAATELVVRNDPRAYLVIVDRLAREPEAEPLSAVLTRAALQLASFIDPHTCRTLRRDCQPGGSGRK